MKIVLEARHLFDGSIAAVASKAAHSAHDHTHPDASHEAAHVPHHHHHALNAELHRESANAALYPGIPALAPNPHASEILFVDPRVANWQTLAEGVKGDVQVVLIDPNRDGIAQVTAALKGRSDLTAIHFLTYGQAGQLELGDAPVTAATLASHASQVASWGDHLAANGDIEFWGCDVGAGDSGAAFVNSVHALTGAQVGASTDATGAAQLGGDWTLERTTGVLAVGTPFTAAAMAAYTGVLDAPIATVAFDPTTVPGDILLGSTFTETVNFSNTAGTAVGYGPFIDLFVPADANQSVTLTSATFLGAAVSFQKVTMTNVAGEGLGAFSPIAIGMDGQPVFISAPPGYKAGDSMYVLVLPFGSFTPGQPAAAIKLTFSMDNKTELSSAPTGQPLTITAIGGFQYGADPLNDPAVDPSLFGGIQASASSTVSLLDVSSTTDLHEGETATGPDYLFNYVVTITPAPVTNGDAIQNLDFTFKLPDQVEYTAGTISITGPGGATGTATFNPGPGGSGTAGGTVTIHFDSLGTDASGAPIVIKIPVFVPQFDANGVAILTPDGAPRTIDTTTIYSYTGAWQATTASVDHSAGLQPISGNSSTMDPTSFVAKSLAIQVTDNAVNGNIVPGEPVTYSIAFEVSDYFSLNNLKIADLIGDGVTLLAPGDVGYMMPTLQLTSGGATQTLQFGDLTNNTSAVDNGETVNTGGSNVAWSYARDDSTGGTGATTVNFNVGMLIGLIEGGGLGTVLVGGEVGNPSGPSVGPTQGVISFVAKVLDKYTNANGGVSLREKDAISDTVTSAGTSATVVAVDTVGQQITNPSLGTVSDGSAVTDTVAPGSMVLSVIAVNGDTSNTTVIEPGDTVTYGITYTLATGDYGDLNLTAYLPEPVFSTFDPLSNGTDVSYTEDTNGADTVPAAGTYKVINPLSGETSTPAVVADGTANSISFKFGSRDDPTNTPGQQVQVLFSVVASDKPFADGLALTSQGTSSYTNAAGDTVAASAIKQTPLEEPEVTVKTGVVSTTGDSSSNPSKGSYLPDTSNPNTANPWPAQTGIPPSGTSGPFAVAGTAAGTLFSPSGTGDPANSDDLNVSGVDGGDLVRVVSTVDNEGHATAWDVKVQGTLPPGYTSADVQNFAVYNSAGQLITGLSATAQADYFSTGLTVTTGTQGIAAGDKVYVVYDLGLKATQTTGVTLTASSEIVNWASLAGGVAAGNGFVGGTGTGEQTLGENAAALSDSATIAVTAPTITKTVISGSDTDLPLTSANDVVLGESVKYQITITVAEGVTSNGGGEITVTDTLPPGMTLAGVDPFVFNGVTGSGGVTSTIDPITGQTIITFSLGTALTNSQLDVNGTVVITYTATLGPGATPNPGVGHQNTAVLAYDTTQTASASTTLTELDPSVTEAMTVSDSNTGTAIANNGTVFSNEDLTYTVTLTNNGTANANDVSDLLNLPAGLIYDPGTLAYTSGGTSGSVSGSGPLDIMVGTLGIGETATFTFQAHVQTNQASGTTMTVDTSATATPVTYSSLPSTQQGHQYTANSATQTVEIGQITPTLSISGESNNTDPTNPPAHDNTQTTTEATVGEVVTLHGVVQIPEGSDPATLTFNLPAGMEYLPGSVTFTLVSPDGDIVSTNGAISGLQQMQDGTPGGANYLSPSGTTNTVSSADDVATFRPGNALPASAITVVGGTNGAPGTITIDLGTLTNNDGKSQGNYVIVQFNAVVENTTSNTPGTVLSASMSVNGGSASSSVAVTVDAPAVTLAKTASAVDNANGTVTYQVTVHNTGSSTAYNVAIDDQAVANESGITLDSATGSGVNGVDSTTGSDLHYVVGSLAAGGTEVITYTVNVASGMTVQNDTAVATWQSLAGPQTLNGSTTGAAGTDTGPRDFDAGLNPTVNTYRASASTDIGTAQGRVWQDLGNDTTTFSQTGGSNDTPLAGVTVTATITQPDGTVITETTTTGTDGTYDFGVLPDGTVVLSLAGNVPAADTLAYDPDGSISSNPPTATFLSSGNAQSNVDFAFQAPDTAPVITNWSGSVDYTEGGTPVTLAGSAGALDSEIAALGGDFDGATLTVQRYNGATAAPVSTDVFTGTGQLLLSGGNVTFGGSVLGTYTEASGKLSITFGAGVTNAVVTEVLDNLAYSSTDTGTVSTGIKIGVTLNDHNTTGTQGTGGVMTNTPVFVTVNEVPQAGIVTATFDDPNNSDPAAVAVAVDSGLSVTSSDTFSGATVQITNYRSGEDFLVAGVMPSNVTAFFDTTTGTMRLTGSNLSAATVQAALRAVEYYDSSNAPDTTTRQLTISVMDSTTGTTTNAAAAAIQVVAHNDSPVLAGNPVTIDTLEDSGSPAGAVGTLVSALTGGGNVTDSDGANAQNGSTPGGLGVVITQADTSEGSWWYSTDGGTSWTEFASSGLPAISATNALHLAADANTRIFFEPTPNVNGIVANALTFRGWDQFDGVANGSLSALPSGLGSGVDTNGSAYSSTAETIAFSVNALNNAPVASGSAALPSMPEDTNAPPAATVGTLFGGNFSDTADQQQGGGNSTGSVANTLAGIAITGNGADPSQGAWQYSTDNGTTWNTIAATGLSDSNALVLSSSAELRFVPVANFNGMPGQLTTRLIDSSTMAITGSATGASLAAGDMAITGVDVSGTHNGGTTAVSAATVDLGTQVSAVNDAPVASGSATLPSMPEDTTAPPAATVGTLFGGNFTDAADQQNNAGNSTGSVANVLAGIAITGNGADPSQGAWQYSTDNGTTWTTIAASGLSDSNALVLSSSAELRFVPVANFNGIPGQLTTRLIDSSTVAITGSATGASLAAGDMAITGVDVSGAHDGGTTAVSAATVDLGTQVNAINDAPVASGSAALPSMPEDTAPPAATIGTLFGGNFSDTADQQQTAGNSSGSVANALAGIAITGNGADPSQGAWQYSTDNGATWNTIATSGLSDSNALVLSSSAELRFVPVANFNGIPGQLTTRLIDSSTVAITGSATGASLAAGDMAIAGVDVSGAHNGGTTAVSAATVDLGTQVSAVNDAPVASGSAALPSMPEDTNAPPAATVGTLFGGNFSDTADQQHNAGNSTGSVANVLAGIAITGNGADPSQGAWQYSTDNGTTWTTIAATGLSDSNALVLSSSAELRFVPVANFNGTPGQLTTRLIDSSTVAITGSATGASLAAGDMAIAGVDVSGAHDGGATAVSAATVGLGTQVNAINDAPVASGSAVLPSIPEDTTAPPATTVGALFGGNFTDTADQQQTAGNSSGSVANALAGIAITGNGADPSQGAWQYSTDNGATWNTIATTGLSDSHALVLSSSAELRFVPVANFNGTPGQLTTRLIDSSNEVVSGSVTGATLAAGDTAMTGVDVSGVHSGGTTAVSAATVDLGTEVNAVNDAPVANGATALPSMPEDTTAPPAATVGTLFGGNFTDTADQQQGAGNSSGSVANVLAGIAITGNGADPSQGAWQYSTDNGATWTTIAATGLSDSNALVLSSSAELRFVPVANFNGIPGQLTTRLIDSSNVAVSGSVTGADLAAGDTALSGVDVSGAHNGGTTAVSAVTVDLGTQVIAANDAPLASGNATLGAVSPDDPNPPGDTVGGLFGHSFNDGADQQQTRANPTGSVQNTLAGIAITGNGADPSQGTWQYSSDGGKTWTDVPATGLGDHDALVLSASDGLRFKPSGSFSGTPGSLTVRLIETTDGPDSAVKDASGVNLGAVGGATRYSASTVLLSTQVSNSNRPVFSEPQDPIPDFDAPNDYNKLTDPNGLDSSQFPDDNLVKPSEGRGYRTSLYGEPVEPQVWLTGSVGNRFVIEEQHSIIQVPSNLFDDTYPGAQLSYDARSPGGAPLPQWLLFDARDLTFTGTPPLGTHGTVEVEIVARDQFGNEATATFQIMVGREPKDLEQMLKHLVIKDAPTPAAHTHAPEHGEPVHGRHAVQHQPAHPQPQAHPQPHAQLGRSAFSAQLRDAGPIGRILQARQIVETLAEVAPLESA